MQCLKEEAKRMHSVGFSGSEIARTLSISKRTIRTVIGRLRNYSDITDQELDGVVRTLQRENRFTGETFLRARLRARGICVTRQRVRDSIHRVEADGGAYRRRRRLHRRVYSVPHYNFLWHVDGWQKLNRYATVN